MYSSFLADPGVVAEIHGDKGKIYLSHLWFQPGNVKVQYHDGKEEIFEFKPKSNGYEYEAEEVVKCIREGKTESSLMKWKDSEQLIDMLDMIRTECGIVYPKQDG